MTHKKKVERAKYWIEENKTSRRPTAPEARTMLEDLVGIIDELETALLKIVNQPLEPAHIYEIADRIKLIAKVALEI